MAKKGILFGLIIIFSIIIVYATSFSDLNQGDFSGIYNNTVHNGTGIILSGANLSGNYTSRVFDAGSLSRWNNLTSYYEIPTKEYLFAVDDNSDVWNSLTGSSWTLVKDDYNGADGNGITSSAFNSSKAYFIVDGQKVWNSIDFGVSWSKLTNDYNGAEGQNAFAFAINKNDSFYIIEGDQDVWNSSNGTTWTKLVSNFNGGGGNVAGLVVNSSNILFTVDAASDVYFSINGSSWTLVKDDYNGADGNGADAFTIDSNGNLYIGKAQAIWESGDSGVTWNKISTDFDTSDGHNSISLGADFSGNVYLVDSGDDIYSSSDGISWTKLADNFNGGNSRVRTILPLRKETNLTLQVKNCSLSDCSDGVWQSVNLNNINLTGRYFQYRTFLSSQEAGLTPTLYNISLDYSILDNIPPVFSNYLESPGNNSAYSSSQLYNFSVNITDNTAVNSVWIEFNGQNYTNLENSISIYSFTVSDLAAGTYSYTLWANDSLGNLNNSGIRYYSVAKAISNVSLNFDKNSPQTYEVSITPACSLTSGDENSILTLNGSIINSGTSLILAAGNQDFNCSYSGNENYTSSSNFSSFIINKANPSLAISGTSLITYGIASDFSGSGCPAQLSCSMDKSNLIYSAGTLTFNYSTAGNENYTSNSAVKDLIINKADNSLILLSSSGWGYSYGIESTFTCNSDYGSPKLYIDNIDFVNPSALILSAGLHNIKCNISETENYTSGLSQNTFTINKALSQTSLTFDKTNPQTYGTAITPTCSILIGWAETLSLTNGTLGEAETLGAGLWDFNCSYLGNENYTSSSNFSQFTINKANPILTFLANSGTSNLTLNYPSQINISAISDVGTVGLDKDNENYLGNSLNLTLSAGSYIFRANVSGNENYSNIDYKYYNITINKATSINSVIASPASPVIYGVANNFSCYNSENLSAVLYVNNINKNNEQGLEIMRVAGLYTVNCTAQENENYSSSSVQQDYIITSLGGDIKLYLNGQESDGLVDYPQQYNITATTLYGTIIIYKDGNNITADNGLNVSPARNSGYYNITAISFGDENHSALSITRWLNITLDIIPPDINMISPQEGGSYGYNTSLPLEYSAYDLHLDSCWYNINDGQNISLPGCQNTTFNASTDGNYILNLYANDILGGFAVKNSTFSILVGAPTVILNSPINIYLNNRDVTFRYKPSDLDLGICELWGDFTGEFKLNQTDNNPINNAENTFSLSLADRNYKWNIRCNDSIGHSAFNGNTTFHIDTNLPVIFIAEPAGTKKSRAGISLSFLINDSSPVSCLYNVYRGLNLEIANTTISCLNTTLFNVTLDADFILNLFATDFAGNKNYTSSSFSIDTSATPNPQPGGGGGGGGIDTNIAANITQSSINVEISGINDIIINPGESKSLSISIKNLGNKFINNCRLNISGNNSGWITSKTLKGISSGEIAGFIIGISAPSNINSGNYKIPLSLECSEGSFNKELNINIVSKGIGLEIKELKNLGNILNISYIINELSGSQQNVNVDFILVDKDGQEIIKNSQEISLFSKESRKEAYNLNLTEDLAGEYVLIIKANSNRFSTTAQDGVLLGKSGVTGLALLSQQGQKIVPIVVLIFVLIVIGYFFIGRVLKSRSSQGVQEAGFVKIGAGHKKGVMIVDNKIVEHLKKHAESNDVKGKWMKINHKKDAPDRIYSL